VRFGRASLLILCAAACACGELFGIDDLTNVACVDGTDCGVSTPDAGGVDADATVIANEAGATRDADASVPVEATADGPNAFDAADAADAAPPPPNAILALAAGLDMTCALRGDRSVTCWGHDDWGQLGFATADAGTTVFPPTDVLIDGGLLTGVAQIAARGRSVCARTLAGSVICWGQTDQCQTATAGCGATGIAAPATVEGGLSQVASIAMGGGHTCAVIDGGTVECWGENFFGEITPQLPSGNNSSVPFLTPVPAGTVDLALGQYFSCARTAGGAVACWGDDGVGQSGAPPPDGGCPYVDPSDDPHCVYPAVTVPGVDSGATAITAGDHHACALIDHRVHCWGSNTCDQLGRDRDASDPAPDCVHAAGPFDFHAAVTTVLPDVDFASVAAGGSETCAVQADGGLVDCFGVDSVNISPGSVYHVAHVGNGQPLDRIEQVVVGDNLYACGRQGTEHVFCWGYNLAFDPFEPTTETPGAFEIPLDRDR
jgi:alpha-tubulin suppressor-like RCC1 family protein